MIRIKSRKFICTECGCENDATYNRSEESVEGIMTSITHCYFCQSKYKVVDGHVDLIPKPVKGAVPKPTLMDARSSANMIKNDASDSYGSYIFGFILFCCAVAGISWFANSGQPTSAESRESTQSIDNNSSVAHSSVPVTSDRTSNAANENYSNNYPVVNKQVNECDFNRAREVALAKVKRLNMHFIEDRISANTEDNPCRVTYYFYVKKKAYDLEGKEYLEDKVLDLMLTYNLIAGKFEFMDGKLFSDNSNQYLIIN